MRVRVALLGAILVAATAAGARAGYVVELDSGKQLTADSYWEEDGEIHLQNGGVSLTLPRARVTNVRKTPDGRRPVDVSKLAPISPPDGEVDEAMPSEELERRDDKVSWRLLRRQRERFEAKARGATKDEIARIEERFRKVQGKYVALQRKLGRIPDAPPKTVAAKPEPAPVVETGVRHVATPHTH